MRILISSSSFYIGGINSFSLILGKSLKAQGHQIFFLVTEPYGSLFHYFNQVFDEVLIFKRKIETLDTYLKRLTSFINTKQIDLLINNGVECIQAILPILNNQIIKFSIVHSIEENELYIGCQNYEYVNSIICVSENVMQEAVKYSTMEKLKVIPIGIEINKNTAKQLNELLNIIYVGRITKVAKNLDNLIDIALTLLKFKIKFKLLIVGDGTYLNELKKKFHLKNLDKVADFTGACNKEKILEKLKQSDIFLLTSEYEGTPNALLEAMAEGVVPVVSNIKGSTDKIIENGFNGFLCEVKNIDEFVKNIIFLKNNPNEFKIISHNARLTAEERYDINIISKMYLTLFESSKRLSLTFQKNVKKKLIIDKRLKVYCRPLHLHIKRILGDIYRNIFMGIKPIKG